MKKPIIFAIPVALVLIAAGYFLVVPKLRGKPAPVDDEEPVATAAAKKKPRRGAQAEPGLIYPLPERVLNLAGPAGTPHYARIELALEFAKPKDANGAKQAKKGEAAAKAGAAPLDPALEPVVARKAQLDDVLVRLVGTRTVEVMTSADGKEALKQEIVAAVEEIVPAPELLNVYIVRLIVQ